MTLLAVAEVAQRAAEVVAVTFVLQTAAVVQQRRLCDRQQWSRDRQQWSYDRLRRSYDRLRRFCNKGARFGEPLFFSGCCEGKVGAAITHAQSEWQKNQVCHPVSCGFFASCQFSEVCNPFSKILGTRLPLLAFRPCIRKDVTRRFRNQHDAPPLLDALRTPSTPKNIVQRITYLG